MNIGRFADSPHGKGFRLWMLRASACTNTRSLESASCAAQSG